MLGIVMLNRLSLDEAVASLGGGRGGPPQFTPSGGDTLMKV